MIKVDERPGQMFFKSYKHGERVPGLSGIQHRNILKWERLSRGERRREKQETESKAAAGKVVTP